MGFDTIEINLVLFSFGALALCTTNIDNFRGQAQNEDDLRNKCNPKEDNNL